MPGSYPHIQNGSNSIVPQVMSGFLNKDYLYGVHIITSSDAVAFRWHEPTDTYQTILLSSVASNHLELPLFDPTDDHFCLAVGVDDQDNMFVAGNHHDHLGGPLGGPPTTTHVIRYNPASGSFTNSAAWSAASTAHYDGLDSEPGANPGTYTYHLFERLTNGTLLHFLSQSEIAGDARGRDWLGFKRINGAWSAIVSDGHFATTVNGPVGEANRVYLGGVTVQPNGGGAGVDRTHVVGVWRIDNVFAESSRDPFYIYSDDLTTWRFRAHPTNGTQTMPITWFNRAGATISSAPTIPYMGHGVYVDPDTGFPAVICTDGDTGLTYRLTWTGTTWDSTLNATEGGQRRDVLLKGVRWRRASTASGRLVLRRHSDNKTIALGTAIRISGVNFSANHDPIWLRERGVYAVNVGDGDSPKVVTWGRGARRNG